MSSGLDTVTRRQIRKAFGAEALDVLNAHEQGLLAHAQAIRTLEADRDRLRAQLERERAERTAATEPLRRQTWRGRLRWLLRGQ